MLLTATGCGRRGDMTQPPCHEEKNGVYYWKTVLQLDSADLAFMRCHDVGRVYLRMFDVAVDDNDVTETPSAVPVASVRIGKAESGLMKNELAGIEFVPVVYITTDALRSMAGREKELAGNIVTRVRNMCSYNGVPNVEEMQLDCDWTKSTEQSFFTLCREAKAAIEAHRLPWCLSSTIRLHQLSGDVPPVDCGVLMVYNTGAFDNPDTGNSIIDADDVEPYLKYLPSYALHLDVAYPTYSWQLLFRNRVFVGLIDNLELSDTACFSRRGDNLYEARRDMPYNDIMIRTGNTVRHESATGSETNKVKDMVEERLTKRAHSNILYHLDNRNLSKYTTDEINRLYSTGR